MDEVMDETFGLGPLETLLKDPTISDILVNRYDRIYVEAQRPARADGRRIPRQRAPAADHRPHRRPGRPAHRRDQPDGRRAPADGSRVNAIIPPLALDGPAMSIRRFGTKPLQLEDLIRHGAFPGGGDGFPRRRRAGTVQHADFSGGTGSGKTTLLNCLSRYIPADERVITIEDAAELQLQQPHVVRLETRPPNIEGKGEVDAARPGEELPAYAAGPHHHRRVPRRRSAGHAPGDEHRPRRLDDHHPRQQHRATRCGRLEVMVAMAGYDIPMRALRQQIASRHADRRAGVAADRRASERSTSVSEITGMEGEQIQMHDMFAFEQTGRRWRRPRDRATSCATGFVRKLLRANRAPRHQAAGRPVHAAAAGHVRVMRVATRLSGARIEPRESLWTE